MDEQSTEVPPQADDAQDYRAKYLYALAEMDNARKRLQRRSDDERENLRKRLLLRFLGVLDNLERAVAYDDSENLRAGLAATLRDFESALADEGVTPISTTGQPFDANVAEAVDTRPAEGIPDETVLDQSRRGYRIGDQLLRPARVVVAKNA